MEMETDMADDLVNIKGCCRLCLSVRIDSLKSIFDPTLSPNRLPQKIQQLIQIQVSQNDRISIMVCNDCIIRLDTWFSYKKQCHRNQTKLAEWLNKASGQTVLHENILIKSEPLDFDTSRLGLLPVKSEFPNYNDAVDEEFGEFPNRQDTNEHLYSGDVQNPEETEENSVKCSDCGKVFSSANVRKRHQNAAHRRDKRAQMMEIKKPESTNEKSESELQLNPTDESRSGTLLENPSLDNTTTSNADNIQPATSEENTENNAVVPSENTSSSTDPTDTPKEDTYEKALTKAELAEDTSDLGTDTDEYLEEKKRKIFKRKRITSETDSDAGITPSKLPAPPTLYPLLIIEPASNSQTDELFSDSEDNIPLAGDEQKEVVQIREIETVWSQSTTTYNAATETFPSQSVTPFSKLNEVLTPHRSGTSRDSQCTCCPRHAELNKEVLRQLHFLRSLTSDIMEEFRRKRQDTVQPNNTHSIFLKFNFPLGSEEDLASFNLYLEEDKNFNEAVDEIAKFGGKNSYEYVKRALSALIKNNLAASYSWLGRRDKKCFYNTNIAKLIIKSSEKLNATQKESEVAIQGWLKRAPERARKD